LFCWWLLYSKSATKELSSSKFRCSFAALLVLLLCSCSPFKSAPESLRQKEDVVWLEVPYVSQARDNDCGPAALASVLKYHGVEVSLEKISDEIYISSIGRTLLPDMENHARSKGLETISGRGTVAQLKQAIDSGKPVIVLMDAGPALARRGHYIVITGYTSDGFLAHAGVERDVYISFNDLDEKWQSMNRLYLMVFE